LKKSDKKLFIILKEKEMKKTKIVCTIGPASEELSKLEALINNGMNVMRMNFSHGSYEEQGARIENVRKLNKEKNLHVGIMLDTKGPEIRTGVMKDGKAEIKQGATVRVTFNYDYPCDEKKIALSYPGLFDDISVGGKILIEDGNLGLEVIDKDMANRELVTKALNTRVLKNKKNVNVPGVILNMDYISDKDRADIEWGCDQDVEYIAASFVRRAQDLKDLRAILKAKKKTEIKIISKIENQEGVDNMEEIIELSDGVMVARGDLGVDVPAWEVPVYQKQMIEIAQSLGRIVITATQMLDSMISNPRPTRAEVSDVFNSVLDGTSATMLSGESANGDFPETAVEYMSAIDERAEEDIDYEFMIERALHGTTDLNPESAMAFAAAKIALEFGISAIVAVGSNEFLYKLATFRPCVNVFAAVKTAKEANALSLAWGVTPVVGAAADAQKKAVETLELGKGDVILVIKKDGLQYVTL